MKRYNHNRSNTRVTNFNMGELVPTRCSHCIAGTSLKGGVSGGYMLASMARQALTQVRVDNFAISCADRILWDDAEDFYTGGETGDVRPERPYIVAPEGGWTAGSLAQHLGFPIGVSGLKCNAIPFRLYAKWINENVIDPNIQQPLPISTASGLDTITNTQLWNMNWPKDIFTTALLEEQLGDEVVIPIATSAPVVTGESHPTVGQKTLRWQKPDGTEAGYQQYYDLSIQSGGGTRSARQDGSNATGQSDLSPMNLEADLTNATGILPSDFNMAMARQAWKTKRNLFGSKFRDWLAFQGIRYSDRRLQLPETLAHGRAFIDINGVLQTAPGTNSFVGQKGGTGTGFASCSYMTYFEEPTTVIHLTCVRPAPLYVNIMPMEWMFEVREDIYTPEFAHVGMAELPKGVLFPTGVDSEDNKRWGFVNRYDYQRSQLNDVSGTMATTDLVWHQGRVFSSQPELNDAFLRCTPSPRIFNDMENTPHIEAAVIRNRFVERNFVSPNGNPKFR